MQPQKIVNLALVIIGAAVFLFLSNMIQTIWSIARLPKMYEWIIAPEYIISFVLVAAACIYLRRHERANKFFNEVAVELSKVTWPLDKKEMAVSTGISCLMVFICSLILLAFDSLWGTIMRGLFSLRSL